MSFVSEYSVTLWMDRKRAQIRGHSRTFADFYTADGFETIA